MRRTDRARRLMIIGLALALLGRLAGELALAAPMDLFGAWMSLALAGWFGGLALASLALLWHGWLLASELGAVWQRRSLFEVRG